MISPGGVGRARRRPSRRSVVGLVAGAVVLAGGGFAVAQVGRAPSGDNPPPNDHLAAALTVHETDLSFSGTTVDAGTQDGETASATARTVWFTWTPAASGATFLVSSGATTPAVKVYTGDTFPLTAVPVTDSEGDVTFRATGGTTYKIQVAAEDAAAGAFNFTVWQPTPGASPNDPFGAAIALDEAVNGLAGASGELASGTATGATNEDGEPGPGESVWYSWVVPSEGTTLKVTAPGVTLAGYRLPRTEPQSVPTGDPTEPAGTAWTLADLVEISPPAAGSADLSGAVGERTYLRVSEGGDFTLTGEVVGAKAPDLTPPVVECFPPDGWSPGRVEIQCTAADADSGLEEPDDEKFHLVAEVPENTASAAASSGTRAVCDVAGNCAAAGPLDGLQLDDLAPALVCTLPPTDWVAAAEPVHCTATDEGSGLAAAGDAAFDVAPGTVEGDVDESVPYATHADVCDAVGNCTPMPELAPAKVDTAAPEVECDDAPLGEWLNENPSITCRVTDDGVGLANPDQSEFSLKTDLLEGEASADAVAAQTAVCDKLGNCSPAGPFEGLKVDIARPAITCDQPPAWTRAKEIEVTCTATDEGSGLAAADEAFTLTASIEPGTADPSVDLPSREVCDLAGNCSPIPEMTGVGLDDQPPQMQCQDTPTLWQTSALTVTCTVDDGTGSGVATADAAFEVSATIADGTVDGAVALGSREVCDLAGNCTTTPAFATGMIDRVMPKAVCNKPSGTSPVEVVVTCVATDDGSGLADPDSAQFTLSTDVGAGNHDSAAVTGTREVCDIAGNCITAGPVGPFDVDRESPAPGNGPQLDLPSLVRVLAAETDATVAATGGAVPVPFTLPAVESDLPADVGCTPDELGAMPLGETLVLCSARDGADRTADGTFTVSVQQAADLAPDGPAWLGAPIPYAGRHFRGTVTVELDGQPITTVPSEQGVVHGTFLAPAGTGLGSHLVVLRGVGADQQPLLVVMPITITDDPSDLPSIEEPDPDPVDPTDPTDPTDPPTVNPDLGTPKLALASKPKRDRKAPYAYKVTSTVTGMKACVGTVKLTATTKIRLKNGRKAVRPVAKPKTVRLTGACKATTKLTLKKGKIAKAVKKRNIKVSVLGRYTDASGKTSVVRITVRAR